MKRIILIIALALPMFAELTDAEVDRVVSEVLAGLPEA